VSLQENDVDSVRDASPAQTSCALGVHSLDHFALDVPDLRQAQHFYASFGLDVREEGLGLALYAHEQPHRWALLLEAKTKRLRYLSFGVFIQDVERLKRHIEACGESLLEPPRELRGDGLWLRDPDGLWVELRAAKKSSPNSKSVPEFRSSPAGQPGAPKRSKAPTVRPSRLGHCLVFTRSVPTAISFYERVLGLRLSDHAGADIAFMHGVHGSDHHLVAFARADGPGLHHCSWDVSSLNDLGLGAEQMARQGYTAGWGLGRHVLGSNYFHYVRDPWGSHCEYSCDMDYIPAGGSWQARDHDAEDAFYVWGPKPPKDWTHNYEADL
jgi:catechol 2,3-dioxygenase-like lactoylglutathione lyase family enzyme